MAAETSEIVREFEAADLGDKRRTARLAQIVERVAAAPAASFPRQMADAAELEAVYDFLGNDGVDWRSIIAPHIKATLGRCAGTRVVRIAHDTTDFVFSGDREGLGTVLQKTKGFFCHTALAVAADEGNTCLGVMGLLPYVRTRSRGNKSLNEWKQEARDRSRAEKESSRWQVLASQTSALAPEGTSFIHVMDQEADDYTLFEELTDAKLNFVIRISSARQVAGQTGGSLQAEFSKFSAEEFREVRVTARSAARGAKEKRSHPARRERTAKLQIRSGELLLLKPKHAQATQRELRFAVVQIFEPNPPEGEEPIQWTLATTEPVMCLEDAMAVVDHYRARWVIEEFFKALKTGCAFQERQLTTYDGLLRALAIFAPIAWQLLLLRNLSRMPEPPPAEVLFSLPQLRRLALLYQSVCRRRMPERPTVRDAMLAIAGLGGHIRNNGDPGWQVLGRGYAEFLNAERIWRAFQREKSDQS